MVVATLTLSGLVISYGRGRNALDGVDLEFSGGRVHAVLGPNGAGKSTLLSACAGLVRPRAGRVLIGGDAIGTLRARERARRVAYMQQDTRLAPGLVVADLVAMARYPYLRVFEPLSAEHLDVVDRCLEEVDAAGLAARAVGQLSGGEVQRVLLARALAQETDCLLLDEPTSSLDPRHGLGFLTHLRRLAAARGLCVVLVTHDLNLAAQYADRAVLLDHGRVVADGHVAAVLAPERLGPVYGDRLAFGELPSAAAGEPRPWVLSWDRGQGSTFVTDPDNGGSPRGSNDAAQ